MVDQQKKEIRKQIKDLKASVSLEDKKRRSVKIFEKLEKLEEFKSSQTVMLYWSMSDEVYTHDFVLKWFGKKEIILPVVKGDVLELRKFTGLEDMQAGESFGIGEPKGEAYSEADKIDLIVVPGVAFDFKNNRLGRGRAYYDKLLKTTKAIKIGVCFDFQLLDSVPVDEYDVKMDLLITE